MGSIALSRGREAEPVALLRPILMVTLPNRDNFFGFFLDQPGKLAGQVDVPGQAGKGGYTGLVRLIELYGAGSSHR